MKIDLEKLATASREHLLEVIVKLCQEIAQLKARIEELERKKGRSATPYSKAERKDNPKKPGRKRGDGKGHERRRAPEIKAEDEVIRQRAPLAEGKKQEAKCPKCGGPALLEMGEASTIDIPPEVKRVIEIFEVENLRCQAPECGHVERGKHEHLPEDQFGATAHRVGPRVRSLGHLARMEFGVTQRKTPALIKEVCGIELSQSALNQDALKHGSEEGLVGMIAKTIKEEVGKSPRVHTDDTGWKIGGKGAQMMGFFSGENAYYQIRMRHRAEEVREVIDPESFRGVLSTDRFKSYDAKEFQDVPMQKCLSHIQRNVTDLIEKKRGRGRTFGRGLKALFKAAFELWHRYRDGKIDLERYLKEGRKLDKELSRQLRPRRLRDEDNARMLRELGKHHQRGNLLRFLKDPNIEPTNNYAERMLRPAVIARKVSQCSKNQEGANAYAAFKSVIETIKLNKVPSLLDALTELITPFDSPAVE